MCSQVLFNRGRYRDVLDRLWWLTTQPSVTALAHGDKVCCTLQARICGLVCVCTRAHGDKVRCANAHRVCTCTPLHVCVCVCKHATMSHTACVDTCPCMCLCVCESHCVCGLAWVCTCTRVHGSGDLSSKGQVSGRPCDGVCACACACVCVYVCLPQDLYRVAFALANKSESYQQVSLPARSAAGKGDDSPSHLNFMVGYSTGPCNLHMAIMIYDHVTEDVMIQRT